MYCIPDFGQRAPLDWLHGGWLINISCFRNVYSSLFKRLLQLRFDFDSTLQRKWVSWQYVNEGMNSYQTTFYFKSGWKGYTNVDNRRMLPNVDPSAWMPFLLPWRTLLRHYMPHSLPSYWLRRLSTRWKKWTCSFFVVVQSQSNRNCNSRSARGKHASLGCLEHGCRLLLWLRGKMTLCQSHWLYKSVERCG